MKREVKMFAVVVDDKSRQEPVCPSVLAYTEAEAVEAYKETVPGLAELCLKMGAARIAEVTVSFETLEGAVTYDKLEALLNNYQTDAVKTALVTTPDKDLLIAACGMVGEYGELLRAKRDEIDKELGDVFWYVARLADLMNLQLGRLTWLPAFEEGKTGDVEAVQVLGEICEYTKKTAGHGKYMTKPIVAMSQLLGHLVECTGSHLEEVLKGNIEKLKARHPSGSFSNDYADAAAKIHEMTNTTEGLSSKCGAEFGGFTLAPENVTCEECKKP